MKMAISPKRTLLIFLVFCCLCVGFCFAQSRDYGNSRGDEHLGRWGLRYEAMSDLEGTVNTTFLHMAEFSLGREGLGKVRDYIGRHASNSYTMKSIHLNALGQVAAKYLAEVGSPTYRKNGYEDSREFRKRKGRFMSDLNNNATKYFSLINQNIGEDILESKAVYWAQLNTAKALLDVCLEGIDEDVNIREKNRFIDIKDRITTLLNIAGVVEKQKNHDKWDSSRIPQMNGALYRISKDIFSFFKIERDAFTNYDRRRSILREFARRAVGGISRMYQQISQDLDFVRASLLNSKKWKMPTPRI